jgi:hypothetical protein
MSTPSSAAAPASVAGPAPAAAGASGAGTVPAAAPALSSSDSSTPALSAPAWSAPVADLLAPRAGPVIAPLDELGIIGVRGIDARRFLHGQLTNDVEHLAAGRCQLNGLCTAKGRLLAVFTQWLDAETVLLLLPRQLVPGILRRLSMFVLRAKVGLTDDSARWSAFGLTGHGVDGLLQAAGVDPGAQPGMGVQHDGAWWFRQPPGPRCGSRVLAVVPAAAAAGFVASLVAVVPGLSVVAPAVWWWSQIDAGVPGVWAATQERYVPQMINLEVLDGVSFGKGCYPGQEVVARSQYLGKLRRRMAAGHVATGTAAAGQDIVSVAAADTAAGATGGPVAQLAGSVVMAAPAPEGGMDLLFECPTELLAGAVALHLGVADGPQITVRPLPYLLRDVTA